MTKRETSPTPDYTIEEEGDEPCPYPEVPDAPVPVGHGPYDHCEVFSWREGIDALAGTGDMDEESLCIHPYTRRVYENACHLRQGSMGDRVGIVSEPPFDEDQDPFGVQDGTHTAQADHAETVSAESSATTHSGHRHKRSDKVQKGNHYPSSIGERRHSQASKKEGRGASETGGRPNKGSSSRSSRGTEEGGSWKDHKPLADRSKRKPPVPR